MVGQGLLKTTIWLCQNFIELFPEEWRGRLANVLQQVPKLESLLIFPQVAFEAVFTFCDEIVPIENQGAKILLGEKIQLGVL